MFTFILKILNTKYKIFTRRSLGVSGQNTKYEIRAFTLIELLVVISIIGVLSTLILTNLNAARERARDTQRKSDLKQIQNSLRLYYNDYGGYPTDTSNIQINGCGDTGTSACAWGSTWSAGSAPTVYMQILPLDPKGSTWATYRYNRLSQDSYTLQACLENKSDTSATGGAATWCGNSQGLIYIITVQ